MIKEKKKISKYNFTKTKTQILTEYMRTIAFSVVFALIVTSYLAFHARNEMIKNLALAPEIQQGIDKQLAQQLIQSADLMKDLQNKSYSVCMHTGELYETAGDYDKAMFSYKLAAQKARSGVYAPYYKQICVLCRQEFPDEALAIVKNTKDVNTKSLVKFKTRAYIVIGDRYYAKGKFISAAKSYEKANFYYNKFVKQDKVIVDSIKYRIVNSYIEAADIMVKSGFNSDAVRFLKKAEKFSPKDYNIRYKLAIILSDSDPEESVKYLEPLLEENPQLIDYSVYGNAFLKAANIADLDDRPTQAKYYRYKVHSIDMFINRKVIYKNDIDVNLLSILFKKRLFTYPLSATYSFLNASNADMLNVFVDFVLTSNGKPLECVTKQIASKDKPMLSYVDEPNVEDVKFKKKIFTKKELENYTIEIYAYKDKKFKTHIVSTPIIPTK